MKRKLQKIGITGETVWHFLDDVFGHQEGSIKVASLRLVDCDSHQEFDEILSALSSVWNEHEMACTKSKEPKFLYWFSSYQADKMQSHMLKPICSEIGLGSPPAEYTNNANECTNSIVKAKTSHKQSELHEFCAKMCEHVSMQTRDIERAFTMDSGPYEVVDRYSDYKHNALVWIKNSKLFKEICVKNIHRIALRPPTSLPEVK